MFCQKCGAEMPDGTKLCPSCGAPTETSPTIQPKKKKKKGHPVLATILIILAVIIIIGAVAGGGDKPKKISSGNGVAATQQKEPEKANGENTVAATKPVETEAFTVGDTVSLNDVNVTLVSVTESEGANYSVPSDGKVFLICEFEIENKSDKDVAVSSMMSFEAYVDDYSSTLSLGAIMASGKTQLDGSVASGKKMAGVVGYEADKGWEEFEIRFTPNVWAGKDITFTYSK